jgi:hypothetical protein
MIRSASSQEDESVFLDEGLLVLYDHQLCLNSVLIDDDPTTANTDSTSGKTNSFFTENYDHENLTTDTTIDDDEISTRQLQRRKSVSSRFRSVSKEIMYEIC